MHTGNRRIATIIFAHFGTDGIVGQASRLSQIQKQKKEWRQARRLSYTHAMTQNDVLQVFRDTGALLEGHFILRSGLHSRQFFQCALALQQMPIVEELGAALATKVRSLGAKTVIAPAMGGLVIGQEVARQLGLRFIFVEKEEGKLVLRRGFKITPGEKILVVEDVVTKGGRVQETIDIVRANGGVVAGVAMVVDRSNGTTKLGVPMFSLIALQVETFDPNKLPPDLAKIPAVKPGSK
jgi:orotate phosphoribosyltransferase